MSNAVLASPELSDAGTITGPASVGDLTISNLQKRSLFQSYRTETLNGVIDVDLGSAQTIDTIALIAHNSTASGTVIISAGSTSAASDFTTGSLNLVTGADQGLPGNLFFEKLTTAQTYRFWKIDYNDTGNPDAYFQIGRLYLSNAFQPDVNLAYGYSQSFKDLSRVRRTRSGEAVPLIRDPYRKVEFTLDFGSQDEMYNSLFEFDRLRGKSKDVLFVKDPAETTHFQRQYVYGLFTDLQPIIHSNFSRFRKRFIIEEIPNGL